METSIPQKEETLIELELTVVQKQYYRAVLERNKEFLNKGSAKTSLMNIMMQVKFRGNFVEISATEDL